MSGAAPRLLFMTSERDITASGRSRLPAYITATSAVIAAAAAIAAAAGVWFWPWALGSAFTALANGIGETGEPSLHQAVCTAYSDFVLTQAHNGYTADQIQRVIDFAGSHSKANKAGPETPAVPSPTTTGETSPPASASPPLASTPPGHLPSVTDEAVCGTPAQILGVVGAPR